MPAAATAASSSRASALPRFARLLPGLVIICAVAFAYANSLRAPFVFDDLGAVEINPTIRQLGTAFNPPADGSTTTGRPVLNFTFALNYAVGGLSVTGYHLTNIALHAITALLLFGVIHRVLHASAARPIVATNATSMAFWSALLWALHPLQTESVTCIAQRTEVLCGLFYLLSIYGFVRAHASATPFRWLAFSVVSCLFGMGTKEVTATAPIVILLLDRTFFAGDFASAWRRRRGYYLALGATWIVLATLVVGGSGTRGVAAGFGLGISAWDYLLTQCRALVVYLQLALWPHPLVLDYGTGVVRSLGAVWWQGLLILALLAGTIGALWRRPVAGFFGAGFFVILAPSSSFIPLVTQTIAEHRMYLPLAILIIATVVGIHRWLGARAWLATGALALAFLPLTIRRNHDYRSGVAIWTDTVNKQPANGRAHVNLGVELRKTGEPARALDHFARAIALRGDSVASGHYQSGVTYTELGDLPNALASLEHAVSAEPRHNDARFALANVLVQSGRPADALPHYEAVLAARPAADGYTNYATALTLLDRVTEAEAQLESALALEPSLAAAHHQLAKLAARRGRIADAERHYRNALALAATDAELRNDYGVFLARTERMTAAATEFQRALALRPAYAEAHANLGNTLLFQNRISDAIAHYEQALRLKPDDARTRENLALARAAAPR